MVPKEECGTHVGTVTSFHTGTHTAQSDPKPGGGAPLTDLAPPSSPAGAHLGSAPRGHTPGEEVLSEKSQPSLAESSRFCSSAAPGGLTWPQSVLPAP